MPEGFTPEYLAIAGLLIFLSIKLIANNILGLKKRSKKEIQQKSEALLHFWDNAQNGFPSGRIMDEYVIFQKSYYLWRGGILTEGEFQETLEHFEQATKSAALLPR